MMEWMHIDAEDFLAKRKLKPDLLKSYGVRSGTSDDKCCDSKKGWPSDWLLFPNERDHREVGIKMRNIDEKLFTQKTGSQSILYTANTNILDRVEEIDDPFVIVEGELDYFSCIQAGWEYVGSAPSGTTRKHEEDGPPKWIEQELDTLIRIRRIIIAVDCDKVGSKLKENMIRYLDRFRLYEVTFPPDCKDMNDVLMRYGEQEVRRLIYSAKPVRVSGVRTSSEIENDAPPEYTRTGWDDLDQLVRLTPGLVVLTGYSSAGKSGFLRKIHSHLNVVRGWHVISAYLEDNPRVAREDLLNQMTQIDMKPQPSVKFSEAKQILEEKTIFVDARQARGGGEKVTTQWLIDLGEAYVLQKNTRALIIDTWSRVHRSTSTRFNEVEQINEELQMLQDFGQEYGVCVILAAHPTKPKGDPIYPPTEYDIAGARSFNDNADGVWILHRVSKTSSTTYFRNAKVRDQKDGGSIGWIEFSWNPRFRTLEGGMTLPQTPNWKLIGDETGDPNGYQGKARW